MNAMRPDNRIDRGLSIKKALTMKLGHASAYDDTYLRITILQGSQTPQKGEQLVLRPLTDGTRVDKNNVGLVAFIRRHKTCVTEQTR